MAVIPQSPIERLEADLEHVPGGTVDFGRIVDALGEGAHGTLLVLLALPNLIPIPLVPGSTTITGTLIVAVAAQLMIGRRSLWLPGFVRRREMPRATAFEWLNKLHRWLPPPPHDGTCPDDKADPNVLLLVGVGAAVLVHGLVLALPVPFANMAPALAVACFGAGLAKGDARFLVAGCVLTVLSVFVVTQFSHWVRRFVR